MRSAHRRKTAKSFLTVAPILIAVCAAVVLISGCPNPHSPTPRGPEIGLRLHETSTSIANGSTHNFGSVNVGDSTTVTFDIVNSGTTGLSLTGGPSVALGNTTDFSVTVWPATAIDAGYYTTFTVRFQPASAGYRSTSVTIASNDTDENPYTFTVSGTGQDTSQANLYLSFLTAPDVGLGSEYLTNDYVFSLATIVHNDGDAAAGSFQIGFYLSQDQYFDSGFDTLIATGDISSLSAGYYTISSGQIALPAGIPGGFYYIIAIADDQNAVSESDETDNGWYFGQVRINQYEDPGVDLAMFSLDTSGYHSAYTSTASFPMEFTGINNSIGDVNSGTCYLSTYLADDTFTLLGAPTELDWSYNDCLASPWLGYDSGVFYLVTATQEADITKVSASPGLHFLYTWIDDELQISETNDDNNTMLWPIVLQ